MVLIWRMASEKASLINRLKTWAADLVEDLKLVGLLALEVLVVVLLAGAGLCWQLYLVSSKALKSARRVLETMLRP